VATQLAEAIALARREHDAAAVAEAAACSLRAENTRLRGLAESLAARVAAVRSGTRTDDMGEAVLDMVDSKIGDGRVQFPGGLGETHGDVTASSASTANGDEATLQAEVPIKCDAIALITENERLRVEIMDSRRAAAEGARHQARTHKASLKTKPVNFK